MNEETLSLTIRTREKIIYKGRIKSLSSLNESGKFDVLPKHANFISLIKDYLIIKEAGGDTRRLALDSGVIRVLKDSIDVFLETKAE